jgi:UDP-glucose 4-epimerase
VTDTESAPSARRVLITGISSKIAGMLAASLEARDDIEEVIGVDTVEPTRVLARTEFVRADLRNPLVARVIEASQVDTIIHVGTHTGPASSGGRSRMKELNVLGAMQLFAAAQRSPHVRRVVLKSSAAVYGSRHDGPGLLHEQDVPTALPADGWSRDAVEVERYAQNLAERRPDVDVTVLRFANFLGAEVDSLFASFFALPVVPSIMGYDPRLQFIHERDAVAVTELAALGAPAGTYNVAAPGVLYLSQCIRLAGRVPVPVPGPLAGVVGSLLRSSRRVDFTPEQLRFLQFGRVSDTTAMVETLGYHPIYDVRAAFEDFVSRRSITGLLDRDEIGRWERELYDFIARRGQERFVAARRGGQR